LRLLDQIGRSCVPTFLTIAEDMSYNHGPTISRRVCDEFMTPYYLRLLELVMEMKAVTTMDTDGDCTKLVPCGGSGRRVTAGAPGEGGWDVAAKCLSYAAHDRRL
jgi:hypothetical protein